MNVRFGEKLFLCKEVYISLLISHTMISQILPLSISWFEQIRSIAGLVLMFWGVGIINIQLLLTPKHFVKINDKYLMIYYIVGFLSCIINYKYGITENIKSLIWTSIHFCILASFVGEYSEMEFMRACIKMSLLPITVWTITGLWSLGLFFAQKYYFINGSAQGWFFNRLFGVYKDPNFCSNASLCVIFICVYNLQHCRHKNKKLLYFFPIFIQIAYILLAYSRGAWIAGIAGCCVFFICSSKNSFNMLHRIMFGVRRTVFVILVLLVLRLTLLSIPPLCEEYASQYGIESSYNIESQYNIEPQYVVNEEISLDTGIVNSNTQRTDLAGKDISNGRFRLWKLSLSMLLYRPILGVSPQNLSKYCQIEHPEIWIVNGGFSYHNGYIAVIVGTGLVGTIVVLGYIIKNVKKFLLFHIKSSYGQKNASFAAIITVGAVAAMVVHEIFWMNSVTTQFFWLALGTLALPLKERKTI